MPRRRKADEALEEEGATPRKSARRSAPDQAERQSPEETPSRRKGILKDATPSKLNGLKDVEATPSSLRKVLFARPHEEKETAEDDEETPTATRNDRSARRKSQTTLQKQIVEADDSEDEHDGQDEAVAQAILGMSDAEDAEDEIEVAAPDTPSRSGRPRGRPKGKRRERTPSPPPDLPPHELYFFQNRTGANKTSANTLPSHLLLNHEDYFNEIKAYEDHHASDVDRLKQLHKRGFDQWVFELEEGFNLCLYGYGSKRRLVMEFAEHMYHAAEKPAKIVVINGYAPGLTIRDVLATLASVVLPKNTKLPAQSQAVVDVLLTALTEALVKDPVTLIVHSLDHVNLRKAATLQILASLAAHNSIRLIATCDTPNFPLLWDIALTTQLNFLFHDTTTFEAYTTEVEVVEDVNALLGRSSRRLGGKDGVGYVLKSLPENARNLFRILVAEQLALADMELDGGNMGPGDESDAEEDVLGVEDEELAAAHTPSRRIRRGRPPKKARSVFAAPKKAAPAVHGVEYRTLYHKAVEEFVCSSEVNFRTLLKEFHDHQMIESRKDAMGTERLIVPFRREELESILLEELV